MALEAAKRLEQGSLAKGNFDPAELAGRKVNYRSSFVCNGAGRDCDLGCTIARIEVEGKIFPFGGICNRFDNSKVAKNTKPAEDLVLWREKRVFRDLTEPIAGQPVIGMNRSLLMNTWFPLFNTFFKKNGLQCPVA